MANVLEELPIGFWIEDGRGKWMGPFRTQEEAVDVGLMLCPIDAKLLKMVILGQFSLPDVPIKILSKRR